MASALREQKSAQRTEMVPVMSNDEETLIIRETVAKFVDRELIPLEPHFLKSKATGTDRGGLTDEQTGRLRQVSKDLGLWGLDAPADLGGHDLPAVTMAAVHEELGRTCIPFVLPPDSPNLRMLQAVGTDAQKQRVPSSLYRGQDDLRHSDFRTRRRRRSCFDEDKGRSR
jgi:alkylation response protein AidB-like acyl-CoA dehydrogenase